MYTFFRNLLYRCAKARTYWIMLQNCPRPWKTFWMLIWPIPWKYRLPKPLDPLRIRRDPNVVHRRYYVEENYRSLRAFPPFKCRDTPLRSLYRLNDCICADNENYTMLESNYFFLSNWRIEEIPDPKDPNPLRYAMLASLVESMVEAYNWKISMGLRRGPRGRISLAEDTRRRLEPNKPFETAPGWASRVPPVDEWVLFSRGGVMNETATDPYSKRRLGASVAQLENI